MERSNSLDSENLGRIFDINKFTPQNLAKLSQMRPDIHPDHTENFDSWIDEIGNSLGNLEGLPLMLADAQIGATVDGLQQLNNDMRVAKYDTTQDATNDDHYEVTGNPHDQLAQTTKINEKAA